MTLYPPVSFIMSGAPRLLVALAALSAAPGAAADDAPPLEPGTYALQMAVLTRADVVVLGEVESVTHQLLLATVEDRDGALWQRQELCAIRMETDARVGRPSLPPSFNKTIPTREFPVTLTRDAEGWAYMADLGIHRAGWDPTQADVMPEDKDDPALRDSDSDSEPAVTIQLHVPLFGDIELYVVQDVQTRLVGRLSADAEGPRVTGRAELARLEQRAVGASNPLFASTPSAVPDAALSPFTLDAVEADATCETLKARYW